MFKKPHTSKTSAPIRSSERRGLAAQVAQEYDLSPDVAALLVPDGILSGKALTHLDEPCTLFTSPDSGDVLWVRTGRDKTDTLLFPTLYTLLRLPSMLPIIETAPMVIAKLSGGADLMAPGVSERSLAKLPDLPAATVVSIVSVSEPGVPKAVGQLAVPRSQLNADSKGKAVVVLHAIDDHLWNAGSRNATPLDLPNSAHGESNAVGTDQAKPTASTSKQLTPQDVDAILRTALLYAISHTLVKDAKAFPIPSSTLYSAHILPHRPANSPNDIDIKHTSYKKLTPFLKAAAKDGLLQLKETKADVLVLSVNASHPEVQGQKGYKTMADAARQAANAEAGPSGSTSMTMTELYRPHSSTLSFWEELGKSKEDALTASEVKALLVDYITKRQLAYAADAKYIKPDPELIAAIARKGEDASSLEALARHEVMERMLEGMQRWNRLDRAGEEPLLRKGAGPRIEVAIKQRQGKKVVTVISGLEAYFVGPEDLANQLQTLCASSTSVNPLPQSTPKKPLRECTVQGDQTKAVIGALIDRGVSKGYIDAVPLRKK